MFDPASPTDELSFKDTRNSSKKLRGKGTVRIANKAAKDSKPGSDLFRVYIPYDIDQERDEFAARMSAFDNTNTKRRKKKLNRKKNKTKRGGGGGKGKDVVEETQEYDEDDENTFKHFAGLSTAVEYSLGKKKYWDAIEDLEEDPRTTLLDVTLQRRKPCYHFYHHFGDDDDFEDNDEDEEPRYLFVRTRKGLVRKETRKTGKKGVHKSQTRAQISRSSSTTNSATKKKSLRVCVAPSKPLPFTTEKDSLRSTYSFWRDPKDRGQLRACARGQHARNIYEPALQR